MGVGLPHLQSLYADTDDPWDFKSSEYELAKFEATCGALSKRSYRNIFELGCGNGQLARRLSRLGGNYVGMDAVDTALIAARTAVPTGVFLQGFYPCNLPDEPFNLIVLSEILYFLDVGSIRMLAQDIHDRWPMAEVICVTWLGPSGNDIEGPEAVTAFKAGLTTHDFETVVRSKDYRIDRGEPVVRR